MPVKIVTDSTCDLPSSIIDTFNISVVPLFVNIEGKSYRDGVTITREAFYRQLPTWQSFPQTAAPGPEHFRQVYRQLLDDGASAVLSLHISESLSLTVNSARKAAEQMNDPRVIVMDSRQLSLGMGFLVQSAAELAAAGASIDEIVAAVEEKNMRTHVVAAIDTLKFLRKSGRMNGVVAGLGSILKIKPILKMFDGNPTSERVRTRRRAFARLENLLAAAAPLERVALVHTHAPQAAAELKSKIAPLLPSGDIWSMDITPVLGAHLGPGAVGLAYVSAQNARSEEL